MDRVNQQLGNYRLIRLIGRGGFADVYLGEHIYLRSLAAIKVLHTRLENDDLQNFILEARTLVSLIHPHIVRLLEFGVEETIPFLIMEYAPNGTLRHRHPRGTRIALSDIMEYVSPLCDALQYAHNLKLIHRDIKPENLLLGQSDTLLLSDFGTAIAAPSTIYQGTIDMAGTISYMAPEQLQGKPRVASDQYALGIIIYEWLSGRCPFEGSMHEVMSQHLMAEPLPLRQFVPELPLEVEQVVMKAISKLPEQRFAGMSAFAAALEHAYLLTQDNIETVRLRPSWSGLFQPDSSQSDPSQPSFMQQESPRRFSRRSLVFGLVGLTAVAASAGGGWALLQALQKSPADGQGNKPFTYHGHSGLVLSVNWSQDDKYIASGAVDGTAQIWNAVTGARITFYGDHKNEVRAVVWSPKGQRLASGSDDTTVKIWDMTSGQTFFTYTGHSDKVLSVAWSPAGDQIVSGGHDKTVQVWDATTGNRIFTYMGHQGWVNSVAWSPDGKYIASGSDDTTVHVVDAVTGRQVFVYRGHAAAARAIVWSPDSRRIASGSFDRTVQLWNALTGLRPLTYSGHTGNVYAVAWSPDGQYIASGSFDRTVQLWNALTGAMVYTYRGHMGVVEALAWSLDGKQIASGGEDTTVQVWTFSLFPS